MTEVWQLYEQFAHRFDRERRRFIGEDAYLNEVLPRIDRKHPRILDLGCGSGHPIARYFIDRGCDVTGVDAAPAMITICRERFPRMTWIAHDMRALNLGRHFEAIVAWDSFFHLSADDQRAMFPVFRQHAAQGALLLFTSGPKASEAIGDLFGRELYHASLDTDEYRSLLAENGFSVLIHRVEDPECDKHTVWLAQYKGGAASNGQPD
jgi:trans-aconitate methyltransferase